MAATEVTGRQPEVKIATTPRNLALIGCGAIARAFYLPFLAKRRGDFGRVWLVDPNDGARAIAASIVPASQAHCLLEIDDDIHLAIVATPNQLHFPVAYEALSRGAHVLVEKPFVTCPEQARRLAQAATAGRRVVAINQTRRFFPLARELRTQIKEGNLGSLKSVVHREGVRLTWPFESGAAFAPGAQRTGVIMDFGVHVIDFYHYLLQPKWRLRSAIHDGFAGPEGLAEIELEANDATVSIRLSRYYPQQNVARLVFERAEISFDIFDGTMYRIQRNAGRVTELVLAKAATDFGSYADLLLSNFLAACDNLEPALCDCWSSLPVIEILDQIYHSAARYPANLGSV